ncbi:hypothetical protein H2198_001798 [Neophaeococcomyces mojaviensis]|uniref:Uncharacterized protein n=1 Tax=Neophaeococcomyces mojaviensis TaxID=3383035 RepID=A0ACC3AFX3_9EURO|nr:hypothetical protein H2198_001798 [Knufia sp. JES_112]
MTEVSFAKSFLTTLDNKSTKYQANHIFDPSTFEVRIPFTLPKLPHPHHPLPPKSVANDLSASHPAVAPGAEPAAATTNTINITLKSLRNPTMTYILSSTPPTTTIASIKQQVYDYLGGSAVVPSVDKIKILHNKKPVPASKATVADVVDDASNKELELGVMVIGGAPDPPSQTTAVKARPPEPAGPGSENAIVEAETGVNPADTASETMMEGVQTTGGKSESEPVQPGEESGMDVLRTTEFWNDLEGFLAQRIRSQADAARLREMFERAWTSNSAAP